MGQDGSWWCLPAVTRALLRGPMSIGGAARSSEPSSQLLCLMELGSTCLTHQFRGNALTGEKGVLLGTHNTRVSPPPGCPSGHTGEAGCVTGFPLHVQGSVGSDTPGSLYSSLLSSLSPLSLTFIQSDGLPSTTICIVTLFETQTPDRVGAGITVTLDRKQ